MQFFKVLLKYSLYVFAAAWMFFLGILVGRGNAPVKFDTQKFQKRLEVIAHDFGAKKEKVSDKLDLKFYDVLKKSEIEADADPDKNSREGETDEILPRKEALTDSTPDKKTSKKRETFKKGKIKISEKNRPEIKKSTQKKEKKPTASRKASKGRYTVQIAAYKNFKDAVTQMSILEEKGISSYRVTWHKNGETWYRVRSGAFADFEKAAAFKRKLDKMKIDSMIIKNDY